MLVELKNGETYNGHLANCDAWMNIYLTQVICTSRDGDRFWKMPECYIRGSTIKYLRISDEVIDNYKEDTSNRSGNMNRRDGGRGGRGGGSNSQRGGRAGGNANARGGAGGSGGTSGGFNQNNRRTANSNSSLSGSNNNLGGARPPKQQRK